MPFRAPRVRCRQIRDDDLDAILNLLLKSGFTGTREFWIDALQRLSEHPTPAGYPKYGYLLEVNSVPVGMLLLISSSIVIDGRPKVRCNVSCWFVWPAFRAYAALLAAQALKHRDATYLNISPVPHTIDMLVAQGYTRYCEGRFTALPVLNWWSGNTHVAAFKPDIRPDHDLPAEEIDLVRRHVAYGCIAIIATIEGRRCPFVFEPMRKYRVVRVAYLVYCRSIDDFARGAGPIGRFLAGRGFLFVSLDANGSIRGLVGKYAEATPKYFKGPDRPHLGDLAYSERAVLGLRFPPRVEVAE